MSWSFSQALVEEFWGECFSGTVPFALLSSTPMPDQFYWPDKPTEHSRIARFGMTCAPLTAIDGEALLTWFQEGSRAKTSASQDLAPDWTASGQGYGQKWQGSLGRFDQDTHSLKTAQLSLLGDSTESSLTLPRWGLMLDGELFQQPIPELITKENGCGFWPTPCASASKGSSKNALTRKDGKDRSKDRLDHAVMSSDGGQFNPEWAEWLMGWPIGHTGLKPLGTGRFQEFMQQHSRFSWVDDRKKGGE